MVNAPFQSGRPAELAFQLGKAHVHTGGRVPVDNLWIASKLFEWNAIVCFTPSRPNQRRLGLLWSIYRNDEGGDALGVTLRRETLATGLRPNAARAPMSLSLHYKTRTVPHHEALPP
jgi:hypothetical protein